MKNKYWYLLWAGVPSSTKAISEKDDRNPWKIIFTASYFSKTQKL